MVNSHDLILLESCFCPLLLPLLMAVHHPWKPAVRRTNLVIIFFADLVSVFLQAPGSWCQA